MKYVKEVFLIFGVSMIGELLNQVLPLPVPAGVYGLFFLLFCLCTGLIKVTDVDSVSNFLLETMPLMFVPASVGLMESFGDIKAILVPLFVISIVSTAVVMVITGKAAELIIRKASKGEA